MSRHWSEQLSCSCGKRFRTAIGEARHRHNFPAYCNRRITMQEFHIGQIWQEVDPRFERFIKVVELTEDEILVQTCDREGNIVNGSRVTRPRAERFNGKRGGYKRV